MLEYKKLDFCSVHKDNIIHHPVLSCSCLGLNIQRERERDFSKYTPNGLWFIYPDVIEGLLVPEVCGMTPPAVSLPLFYWSSKCVWFEVIRILFLSILVISVLLSLFGCDNISCIDCVMFCGQSKVIMKRSIRCQRLHYVSIYEPVCLSNQIAYLLHREFCGFSFLFDDK